MLPFLLGVVLVFVYRIIYRAFISCVMSFFLLSFTMVTVQAQVKGSLHLAIALEPPVLDPALSAVASVQKITYQNIFEGLTKIDSQNRVQPSLAKSWNIDKTGLIYTFTLRKKIFFHDHSELTATIVKHSLERVIAFNRINPSKDKFANIEQIYVINRHVIRIKLAWSDGDFLYNLGLGAAVIQHPKSWSTNNTNPIGTGPYRFVEWKKGKYIKLQVNNHYWGKLGRIKNIKITFIQARSQLVNNLLSGVLDGYSSMTDVAFLDSLFATRQDYILKIGNTNGKIIVAMNHANKMLASIDVRKAISMAINKKEIADTANFITGAEIGSHYSPDDIAYLDLTKVYPFNIFDAKQLIEKSKVARKILVLVSPPPAYAKTISLHVQQMLKVIGITVRIEEVTWKEWLTRVYQDKDYDLTVIAHTEPHDLDIYARDDYYFNYNSREYKQIIGQLNQTTDENKRNELLKKAQQKLTDDAVNVFLFMLPKIGVWHKELRGYWVNEPIPAMIFSQMYWQN